MNEVLKLRKKLGLSQDAFAAKLGIAPYTVRRWERELVVPSPLSLKAIEVIFGIKLDIKQK